MLLGEEKSLGENSPGDQEKSVGKTSLGDQEKSLGETSPGDQYIFLCVFPSGEYLSLTMKYFSVKIKLT